MKASEGGHVDVLNMLLKHGGNVNESNENGQTALGFASFLGHEAAVGVLLENNAVVDKWGWTALMNASAGGFVDVLNLLLKHGANVNKRNQNGQIALIIASSKGHTAIVDALLKQNASLYTKDKESMSALMYASRKGDVNLVNSLVMHGASWNISVEDFDYVERAFCEPKLPIGYAEGNGSRTRCVVSIDPASNSDQRFDANSVDVEAPSTSSSEMKQHSENTNRKECTYKENDEGKSVVSLNRDFVE